MLAFWEHLGSFEKVLWAIAILSSVVLLLQLIFTVVGLDSGHDADVNHDLPGEGQFHVFSSRSITAFFALFGWVGLSCLQPGRPMGITLGIAFLAGTAAMFLVAGLFYALSRMTEDATFNPEKLVGKQGKVYIPVPGARAGTGKVTISFGSTRELDAVTDGDALPTGASVRVKAVLNGSTMLVERP